MNRFTILVSFLLLNVAGIISIHIKGLWGLWRRKIFLVAALYFIIAIGLCISSTRPWNELSIDSAAIEAKTLFRDVGGFEKVRTEAIAMFNRFGPGKVGFEPGEMQDFSTIVSLGQVDCIVPESSDFPAYIKVRVRNHVNGYTIMLSNPNSSKKPEKSPYLIEISDAVYIIK